MDQSIVSKPTILLYATEHISEDILKPVLYGIDSLLGKGTNWQDAIFQTAFQQQHQVAAQGGTDKIQYYVSAGYMNQDGTIIGSKFDRLSVRTNLDAQLKKWLKLGLSATFTNSNDDLKLTAPRWTWWSYRSSAQQSR